MADLAAAQVAEYVETLDKPGTPRADKLALSAGYAERASLAALAAGDAPTAIAWALIALRATLERG